MIDRGSSTEQKFNKTHHHSLYIFATWSDTLVTMSIFSELPILNIAGGKSVALVNGLEAVERCSEHQLHVPPDSIFFERKLMLII